MNNIKVQSEVRGLLDLLLANYEITPKEYKTRRAQDKVKSDRSLGYIK